MNKINALFANNKDRKLLSLYFCAGCPTLEGTGDVIKAMERKGIDMIEVGIPFSDPLADGPVIQSAGTKALKNGMTVKKLFGQLKAIKDEVQVATCSDGLSQSYHALWHREVLQELCRKRSERNYHSRPSI